jgi:Peptidase family M23
MQMRRPVGGFLAIAAAVLLTGSLYPAASAAPRSPATPDQAGLRITGTVSWTAFTKSETPDTGGDTQSGKFFIDMFSADGSTWTSKRSTYDVKDDYDVTWPSGSCTGKATGTAANSGPLPAFPTDGPPFVAVEWTAGKRDFGLFFHIEAEAEETVTTTYSGSSCPAGGTQTNDVSFAPNCWKDISAEGVGFHGKIDGDTDSAKIDCHGLDYGIRYDITGTLHVDAYLFVLPRDVFSPAKWKEFLTKRHERYPAADIPVPEGTPFYAVTAGRVVLLSNKTCGSHGITLIGMDGVHYTYCHASEAFVSNGEQVGPGAELGLSGHEGSRSTGPHLHFEIRVDKEQRCPQDLLWALYDGTQPPPDASFVKNLPADHTYTICSYEKDEK